MQKSISLFVLQCVCMIMLKAQSTNCSLIYDTACISIDDFRHYVLNGKSHHDLKQFIERDKECNLYYKKIRSQYLVPRTTAKVLSAGLFLSSLYCIQKANNDKASNSYQTGEGLLIGSLASCFISMILKQESHKKLDDVARRYNRKRLMKTTY